MPPRVNLTMIFQYSMVQNRKETKQKGKINGNEKRKGKHEINEIYLEKNKT
jgi:hypothetical protein